MYRLLKGYLAAHRAQVDWPQQTQEPVEKSSWALSHASFLLFVRLLVQWPT